MFGMQNYWGMSKINWFCYNNIYQYYGHNFFIIFELGIYGDKSLGVQG